MTEPCISISTLSLDQVKTGEHVNLVAVNCGQGVNSRLTSMGFTPGVEIEMRQNYGRGPLVVNVRGTRVALGRGEARKTVVQRRDNA